MIGCGKPKDILVIADVGNLEVLEKLSPLFDKVYFVDHHLSSLVTGLNDENYIKKYPNVKFFYDEKHSACKLLYNLVLPANII